MLSESELLAILNDWSFWETTPPATQITRHIDLPPKLSADLVFIIQGVRRCGKSTLLTQIPYHYELNYEHCFYCNFEDPRLLNHLTHELLIEIVKLARKRVPDHAECYFFFDEIQHVNAWEKWMHVQLERPKKNFFVVTGSNSCLLNNEYGTALTGRHTSLELYPCNYQEFLSVHPKGTLEEYLLLGGFPRPLTHDEPQKLLREYFNDIILRDVIQRVKARSQESVMQVAQMAFETAGSQLSYRKIAAATQLSVDTVKLYLGACQEAYLLFSCPYFAFSEKKRASRHKKFYPVDTGLRHVATTTNSPDLGKSLEILVFKNLYQRYGQVYFWEEAGKGEVDFVTLEGNVITPYQVTWLDTKERHTKALNAFYEAFPHAQPLRIINKDNAVDYI